MLAVLLSYSQSLIPTPIVVALTVVCVAVIAWALRVRNGTNNRRRPAKTFISCVSAASSQDSRLSTPLSGGQYTVASKAMKSLNHLFDNNAAWAARMLERDARFFARLQAQQAPEYLWIGCSDSRVPANEIIDLAPGELFVHRNVGNVVVHTDLNCLSVLQYAVDVLRVKHVIVTGHYGCGGVRAAYERTKLGLIDNWLRHIDDVRQRHEESLSVLSSDLAVDRLCELNVIEQARHVCETTVVQDAWTRRQALAVHGWIYGLGDGRLHDLGFHATRADEVMDRFREAIALTTHRFAASEPAPGR